MEVWQWRKQRFTKRERKAEGQISFFARVFGEMNKSFSPFVGFMHAILRRAMEVPYEIASGSKRYVWL